MNDPRYDGKTVVMVWEHHHIADRALELKFPDQKVTLRQLLNLDKLTDVPDTWPGQNYDYFWIVEFGNPASDVPTGFRMRSSRCSQAPFDKVPSNEWGKRAKLPLGQQVFAVMSSYPSPACGEGGRRSRPGGGCRRCLQVTPPRTASQSDPPLKGEGKERHRTSTFLNCQGSLLSMSSGNRPGRSVERRPVGIVADHRAEIRHLHFEAAAEIHLVGLDDAGVRILQRPDHAGEHRRGHLQAGGVLVGRDARASPRSRAASRTNRRSSRGRRAARRVRRCRRRSRSRRECGSSSCMLAGRCRTVSCSDSTASLHGMIGVMAGRPVAPPCRPRARVK